MIPDPEPLDDFPEISHAAVIPKGVHQGKVLLWTNGHPNHGDVTERIWLFDPQNPNEVYLIEADPAVVTTNFFCSGMSWSPQGDLVIAGGENPFGPPAQTYFFFPQALLGFSPNDQDCVLDPPVPVSTGGPFSVIGPLSLSRFYPTLTPLLLGDIFASQGYGIIPGASTLVLGGATDGAAYRGNDWWQALSPSSSGSAWSHTMRAEAGGIVDAGFPPLPASEEEVYDLEPDSPTTVPTLDYYPRAVHLSSMDNPSEDDIKNIFVGFDVRPDNGTDPSPGNAPGMSWVLKPRYHPDQTEWKLTPGPLGADANPGFPADRFYGSQVLIHDEGGPPPNEGRNRVILFGGYHRSAAGDPGPDQILTRVEELEFSGGSDPKDAVWMVKSQDMLIPRYWLNSVILPTREILLIGGSCGFHPTATPARPIPAHCPELYDPGDFALDPSATSQVLAQRPDAPIANNFKPFARMYHNVAVLLPDGRVLNAGGQDYTPADSCYPDGVHTGEMFSPPYLGYGPRPTIYSVPGRVSFETAFKVTVDHEPNLPIEKIVLLRPGAVTHHFDYDQRYVELKITDVSFNPFSQKETLTVIGPEDDLAPPGYYMLFAVRATSPGGSTPNRTASVGQFIFLE